MEQDQNTSSGDKSVVSVRTMDAAFAILITLVGIAVIWDSLAHGAGWERGLGPQAGYFPFWIGCFIVLAGVCNTIGAFLPGNKAAGDETFVTREQLGSVLRVFVPTLLYVVLMHYLGLYVAAALYIGGFMMVNGGFSIVRTLPYVIIIPVVLFYVFERLFLISLPKGPVEALLGL